MEYSVYVYRPQAERYAVLDDPFGYERLMSERLKKAGGSAADAVLQAAVLRHERVRKADLKKLMQALRRHREVGLSDELWTLIAALAETDVIALSLGEMGTVDADFSALTL